MNASKQHDATYIPKLCPPEPIREPPIDTCAVPPFSLRHAVTPLVAGRFVREQGQTQGISITDAQPSGREGERASFGGAPRQSL